MGFTTGRVPLGPNMSAEVRGGSCCPSPPSPARAPVFCPGKRASEATLRPPAGLREHTSWGHRRASRPPSTKPRANRTPPRPLCRTSGLLWGHILAHRPLALAMFPWARVQSARSTVPACVAPHRSCGEAGASREGRYDVRCRRTQHPRVVEEDGRLTSVRAPPRLRGRRLLHRA